MPRSRQPIRVASGQPYGERKALEELQKAAPVAGAPAPAMPAVQSAPAGPTPPAGGAFGPTRRPDEPITAGIPTGPGSMGSSWYLRQDPKTLLRAAYEANPDPWLLRLLQDDPAPDPFFKPLRQEPVFNPPPPVLKPAP